MSENSSSASSRSLGQRLGRIAGVIAWLVIGFLVASQLVRMVVEYLVTVGVPLGSINGTIVNTVGAAVVYLLAIAIVIGGPQLWGRFVTTRRELGLDRLPGWRDLAMTPLAFVAYYVLSLIVMTVVTAAVPGFDVTQAQETGFTDLSKSYEYVLAFATLVVLAPVAEEILLRGYLYGKLRRWLGAIVAGLLTSVVFGALHGQWNVGIDVFVLSLVLCGLREYTGSIWAGILLHMLKNGLAFYLLFINPVFLHTIGG